MFTSLGFAENSFAVDLNNDTADLGTVSDVSDNVVNSQDDEILEVDYQDQVVGKSEITVSGDTFTDIQEAIEKAESGDVIRLDGRYVATEDNSPIIVRKNISFVGSKDTVLDGQKRSLIVYIGEKGAGTSITGVKFINGEHKVGAAISVYAKNTLFEKCIFENNHCQRGGAITTAYDLTTAEHCIVRNCTFTNNTGYYEGYANYSAAGAASIYGQNSVIEYCVFDSNFVIGTNKTFGGAIQVGLDTKGSNIKVSNCVFRNNWAKSLANQSHGGAGCVRDGTSYINCIFINNTADEGGALTFHASGSIVNCTFIDNVALIYGGALSTGYQYDYMDISVIDCNFQGNTAPEGGAIQAKGLNVHIIDSNFKDNNVTTYGGAVKIEAEDVTVTNSKFNSNNALVDGGAIYIDGKNTIIEGSSFISNNAIPDFDKRQDGLGGAIYVDSSQTRISNNYFMYNTARNGSAIYYGKSGERLTLMNNTLIQNQAWGYELPISAKDIYYGDVEKIKVVFYGGNNIADFDNLDVSNAIYNSVGNNKIVIDGEFPVSGATNSGKLYQDSREYNVNVLLTIQHEDGTIVYNELSNTNYLGEVSVDLDNLKPGKYSVFAKHFVDTYYTELSNVTTFNVIPKVDNSVSKSVSKTVFDFEDVVVWTLNVTNKGPNDATGVVIYDVLPDGLTWIDDNTKGKYDPKTGKLDVGVLKVNETAVYEIRTVIEKTGVLVNKVNITSDEVDTDLSNNYDEKTITVNPSADLSVVKYASNPSPKYMDGFDWVIEVTNNGPDVAYDVVVKDVLSNSVEYKGSDGNYDVNTGIWTIGTLENGKTVKLNIHCVANATGLIQNEVTINGSVFDPNSNNNHDFKMIYVNRVSDLSVKKSVNCSEVNYLDFVRWTLVIKNNGPDAANNVVVEDILPDGFTYINYTSTKGEYVDGILLIESMDVGETITVEIITQADESGEYVNIVNVTADNDDNDLTNNQDNESVTVKSASDLSVIKFPSETNPNYHDEIEWTIEVTNYGPDVAHNVVVIDLLPKSLIWKGDDTSGEYDPKTGKLIIPKLDVDETFSFVIRCLVNASGEIQNNVSVNGDDFDYNLTNNEYNSTIDVKNSSDVSIIKLVNKSNPAFDDLVKWTIIISNRGPDKATNVYVEETLPEGLIFVNYTATKGFYDNGIWAMCCLNNGDEETLEIITRVNKTGRITNFAHIFADEYDPNEDNNEVNSSIGVNMAVDVEVVIKVNNTSPLFGEKVNWIITVKNNGPDNANGVVVHDNLPEGLVFVDSKATKGTYDSGNWFIGELNIGESQRLEVITTSNVLGEINNNVHVESEDYDWNESNNYDNSLIDVKPIADLSVTKSVDSSSPDYKDTIKWTIIATNNGPNRATNVVVVDVLPEGLKFVKSNGNYKNNVWHVGNLDVGESKELEIQCKVTATGKLINNVKISGDDTDTDLTNNQYEKSIDVCPASDLSITKIASKYKYGSGEIIRYTIEVVNNGPDTAKNIKVNEILDDLLKLKSFKVNKGKFDKSKNIWSIYSLGYGESALLYIKAVSSGSGTLKNKVLVSSDTWDYDLSNNDDSAVVKVTKDSNKKDKKSSNGQKKYSKNPIGKYNNFKYSHSSNRKYLNNPGGVLGNAGGYLNDPEGVLGNANGYLNEKASNNLENHKTANPFWILIVSIVFSLIFMDGGFSKRR